MNVGKYFKLLVLLISLIGLLGPFFYLTKRDFYYGIYLPSLSILLPIVFLLLTYAYLSKFLRIFSPSDLLVSKHSVRAILTFMLYFLIFHENFFSSTLFLSISLYLIFFPMKEETKDILFVFIAGFSFLPVLQIIPLTVIAFFHLKRFRKISGVYFYPIILLFTQYISSNFLQIHRTFHLINSYAVLLYTISYVAIKEDWRIRKRNLISSLKIFLLIFLLEFFFGIISLEIPLFNKIYDLFMISLVLSVILLALSM